MTPSPDADETKRFAPYVPLLLLTWPPEAAWRELEGTLVSADISGFTALSERLAAKGKEGAEELSTLICDCFDGMIDDALDRGGDIIKFGGDALLVWFEGDGHARRAASAAIAMRTTIRRERRASDGRKVPLSISIGVNSGAHHFVQIVGAVPDLIVTGPGATATVGAESDAAAGTILATPSTAALLPRGWLGAADASGVIVTRRIPDPPTGPTTPRRFRRPASSFVPEEQREVMLGGLVNEHRQVAVSFLAFGGADRLVADGQLDELARRLRRVTDLVTAACARNGTFLLATDIAPDGGKFVIAGGAPRALGNNEDRLLHTIREVVDADPGLHLHAGVHRASLFAGDLGSARRRVYTTLGDGMNLSARLSARAGAGEIVVSRTTMEWSSVEFEITPLPPFHVKGKAQPIHAGLLGRFVGSRPPQLPVGSRLVGRRAELEHITALIGPDDRSVSSAIVLRGEPGVGCTRLLAEVAAATTRRAVVVRCSPLDRVHGRSAIADVLRSMLGLPATHPSVEVVSRLRDTLTTDHPDVVALLPLLGPVFDIGIADTESSAVVPVELRASRAAQLLVQIVRALIVRPTVLLVDDAHHADSVTASALQLLCGAELDVPLAVVMVTRADEPPDGHVVELGPLPDADVATLVDGLIGDAELSSDTLRDIVTRSGGNPLFATEIVGAVLDGASGLPDSLEAAVQSRLDRLSTIDRRVLCTAAVVGAEVELALLARLLDPGVLADHDRWARLDEFLERVGPGVVGFRFDTHRRVAYESLPFRSRRELHRTLLHALEHDRPDGVDGDGGRERLARMAHHAAAGGDDPATWRYATAAAALAADRGLFGEAAPLYRLAWAARRAVAPAEMATVGERAGDVFEVAGDFTAADDAYSGALTQNSQPIERARLHRKRGDVAERRGDYDAALQLYRRAERELRAVNWARGLREQAQLDCARSGLALRQAHFDDAWRFGNLALAQAERVGDWATAAHAALMVDNLINQMSWSGVHVSRPDVLGLHERAGDLLGAARWLTNQAVDRYYEGAWDEAVAKYRESAEQCARFGHLASEATALNNIGEIDSDRGNYDAARSLFRTARRSWRAIGFGVGIALVQSNLGRLATRIGEFGEADELLADAVARFAALGMASMGTDARLRQVENLLLSGRDPEWWPDESDLEEDEVVRIYAQRLRAVAALVAGAPEDGRRLADDAIDRARQADLPFDLVLCLRVRLAAGGEVDQAEIDSLHQRLGIVLPPAVVPRG